MTADRDTLGRSELEISRRFAGVCPLGIIPEPIEKREPREPDILCKIRAEGPVAFEMVEIIDQDVAKRYNDMLDLSRQLTEKYEGLPHPAHARLSATLGNALVHVCFSHDASMVARRRAVPAILQFLATVAPEFFGECNRPVAGVDSIRIARGRFNGPCFDVDAGGSVGDPTIARLREKFGKTYETKTAIELLVHYELNPMFPDAVWLPGVRNLAATELNASPFRRVWIYDVGYNAVKFVYPEPS